ncbi:MAG: N-acetylmuramoyl-L-alanine amidase [Patescibacteria group bacterium]|nr:N-acetylmuramoyl-L-alanine amidase [Patescibacteria group bacterium]MDE1945964.1 N-acetylmuramoyl-L-alanine amidase [Patescibacteria group bacterium]
MKKILAVIAVIILGGIGYAAAHTQKGNPVQNPAQVEATPSAQKISVFIVPGHEPDNGGTNYKNLYERNLVVPIADDLQNLLDANGRYAATVARDANAWAPTLAAYFQNDWNAIVAWEQAAKAAFMRTTPQNVNASGENHNNAAVDDALRLYGMTKWADENNIDLMVHVHLNNYPEAMAKGIVGKYSGFVVYMPASNLKNSAAAKPIAQAVFDRLSLYNPVSNLPVESAGLEEDSQLIAMGAYDTADMPSILVEYEYIYEPQIVNPATRAIAFKDFAYQTYLGLEDFYNHRANVTATSSYDPADHVYDWQNRVTNANADPRDIYAMQTALIMDGDYPPKGKTRNDCPHSGTIGACTETAVAAFQQKNGITGENAFGERTFEALKKIYENKS